MDDFNNFFDDQRNSQPEHTPVYHTPSPKHNNKLGPVGIICVVLAVVMSVVVLVNVIVLASLKQTIAEEYVSSMRQQFSADMEEQYQKAIEDAIKDKDIVEDVTNSAAQKALEALNTSVGKVANAKAASVARLYMYKDSDVNPTTTSYNGIASGFLITDSTDESHYRYVLTNAHCVRYEASKTQQSGYPFGFGKVTYQWESYGTIICMFDGDTSSYYRLEIVAYGAYNGDHLDAESDQPDIALLRISGKINKTNASSVIDEQPSNETHPSLTIAINNAKRGSEVALIGNPEGVGSTNSISTGNISQIGISISSWGAGTFVMTDAAVNGGNSGGPMIDILGNVVGIVESKLVDESIDNMGFALDVNTIRTFVGWASQKANNQLKQNLNLTI